jgi:hypothetical protein
LPRDQAPVPGEQSARGHDPVEPQARGQQPGQGGDHGAVGPVRPGAGNLAAQDGDLMPEHQDLSVLGGALRARSASQPNSLIMSRQTRRTSMIVERNGRSQALARVGTAHASTATLLLTATHGVLGTHSRTATAQPAELSVLYGERDARYHGKGTDR